MLNKLSIYLRLMRINKPIGWLLLLQFIYTLIFSIQCYPLQPGGLIALQILLLTIFTISIPTESYSFICTLAKGGKIIHSLSKSGSFFFKTKLLEFLMFFLHEINRYNNIYIYRYYFNMRTG